MRAGLLAAVAAIRDALSSAVSRFRYLFSCFRDWLGLPFRMLGALGRGAVPAAPAPPGADAYSEGRDAARQDKGRKAGGRPVLESLNKQGLLAVRRAAATRRRALDGGDVAFATADDAGLPLGVPFALDRLSAVELSRLSLASVEELRDHLSGARPLEGVRHMCGDLWRALKPAAGSVEALRKGSTPAAPSAEFVVDNLARARATDPAAEAFLVRDGRRSTLSARMAWAAESAAEFERPRSEVFGTYARTATSGPPPSVAEVAAPAAGAAGWTPRR